MAAAKKARGIPIRLVSDNYGVGKTTTLEVKKHEIRNLFDILTLTLITSLQFVTVTESLRKANVEGVVRTLLTL